MVHGQESPIHIADTSIQCVKHVRVCVWGGGGGGRKSIEGEGLKHHF